jgi:acetyl esterase/lipase
MMRMSRRGVVAGMSALVSAELGGCASLATLNALNALTPGDGGVRQVVSGAAFGSGPRQRLDVYAPARLQTAAPVVVFFYGGNWASGYRQGYRFVAEAFGARGFVVAIPDYRLVPQVRFPGFVEDGAAAVRWVRDNIARYGGDPGRIALAGHSAGSYIAVMVSVDARWLSAADVAPSTVRAVVGLAGPYDFYPFDVPASQNAFGSAPDPQATQPINFARADAPPAFLAAGTADTVVKPRNSIRMVEALKAKGASAELKLYPGLGHIDILLALSKPFRGKAPVLADSVGFLRARLGGTA